MKESSNAKWNEGKQVKFEKSMAKGNGYSTPTTIGDIPKIHDEARNESVVSLACLSNSFVITCPVQN